MEAGRTLLSSPPPPIPTRTHLKNCPSSSVLMLHEQSTPAVAASIPTTTSAGHFPTSVLLQEQRDESQPFMSIFKEERMSQATLDRGQMETETSINEAKTHDLDQLVWDLESQLLHGSIFTNLLPLLQIQEHSSLTMQPITSDTNKLIDVEPACPVDLAKRALSSSEEAALLTENSTHLNNSVSNGLGSTSSSSPSLDEVKTVRSTRRLQRQSKNRRVPKAKDMIHKPHISKRTDVKRKLSEGYDPNDPLRLFLWGPETRQLLTAKEESELIVQVQDLMRLEEVKHTLKSQFGREPSLVEWAKAVGVSYPILQSQIHSGNSSREKLITANLRMVVHIAKQYQGHGLSLQDLLQEGSVGLMKSVEKFKPQAGCRFASYAYWWIRQAIKKAIFQNSRTIRLPESIHVLLGRVMAAKRSYAQEGNHDPTNKELAERVGIAVDRLEKLHFLSKMPLSLQQPVWADQDTTFQEITADTEIEIPDVSVEKQLMRQHVRGLLNILNPKERQIIKLRFGINDGKQRSLSEIGNLFGLSKERVRQLENRALYKLKQCLNSHGLKAYLDLLV